MFGKSFAKNTAIAVNKEFESGNLKQALQTLKNKSGQATGKDRFLYFVNKGLVLSMMGQYDESNKFFELN